MTKNQVTLPRYDAPQRNGCGEGSAAGAPAGKAGAQAPRRAGHRRVLASPARTSGRRVGAGKESGSGTMGPPLGVGGETTATGPGTGTVLPGPQECAPPRGGRGPLAAISRATPAPLVGASTVHAWRAALPLAVLGPRSAPPPPQPKRKQNSWRRTAPRPGRRPGSGSGRSRSVPGPPRSRPPLRFQRNLAKRGFQSFLKESWKKTKQQQKKTENKRKNPKPRVAETLRTRAAAGSAAPPGEAGRTGRGPAAGPAPPLLRRPRPAAPRPAPLRCWRRLGLSGSAAPSRLLALLLLAQCCFALAVENRYPFICIFITQNTTLMDQASELSSSAATS